MIVVHLVLKATLVVITSGLAFLDGSVTGLGCYTFKCSKFAYSESLEFRLEVSSSTLI